MSISIAIITNMLLKRLIVATLVLFCTGTTFANEKPSSWQFEAGASAGRPTPILLNAGVGYKNLFFRAMAGAMYFGTDDYWVGYRGGFSWEFFHGLPFTLSPGIGCGYAFAKAPNEIYKAMNRANSTIYVRSYNYKEVLDISMEMRASIYGFFTYIAVPVHGFMKHDEPSVIWQVGYAYKF